MRRLLLMSALALGLLAGGEALAAEPERAPDGPMLLSADHLAYDSERELVIATGHVEIHRGQRILLADEVRYHEPSETVTAAGNVSLLEPTGDVLFADYVELTGDLRDGVIESIRVLLSDGSRMAANGARRIGGYRTEMRKAVYSPCDLCAEHPQRAPLWQIKAVKVVHDQESHDIEYEDAWLEFFGVPVAYTPYFTHPDPTVKRRSGFLAPTFRSSSRLGFNVTLPYFWAIDAQHDFTFAPRFTAKEGVVLAGEYRGHAGNGLYSLRGAITRADKRDLNGNLLGGEETRGYVAGLGAFALNPIWQWGFDFTRSTDDTFMRRYDVETAGTLSTSDTLVSNAYVEGIDGRRLFSTDFYAFQGLDETDDPSRSPLVLPLIDFRYSSDPDRRQGQWELEGNSVVLTRREGSNTRRVSLKGGWTYRGVGSYGDLYTVNLGLRTDGYFVENVPDPGDPARPDFDGLTGRVWPEASFTWRYPFVSASGGLRQIIEPVVQAVISPNGGNSEKIPNEDSQDFEFDDTRLFSANRFTGYDRVEGGPRINYGLNWSLHGPESGSISAFLGQSYRLRDDDTFRLGSGLSGHVSDYVGRIKVIPNPYVDLLYRFRFDRDDFSARRSELVTGFGPSFLRLNIDYIFLDSEVSRVDQPAFGSREQLNLRARLHFLDNWSLTGSWRRDLTGNDRSLQFSTGIVYEDECFRAYLLGVRTFTRDREIEPSTDVLFQIELKNLG
ncbi:MAG TPA: LPS assembly protein LptD [Alphaproteobacteria bacterium]|nr:LPS assembly protein LptD [Alphaproteobacteria bacterium]